MDARLIIGHGLFGRLEEYNGVGETEADAETRLSQWLNQWLCSGHRQTDEGTQGNIPL